jgi:cytochrome b561
MSDGLAKDARKTHPTALAAYSTMARVLHWATAVLHRSIGAVVIPLVILRLGYRIAHAPKPLPEDVPPWQQAAARATHWALYALLMVQPFIGWVATSAFPAAIMVFGLFELPPIWSADRPLSDRLFVVHARIAAAIAGLATLHIGAALHHHFVRRDGVLMRMITS